MKRGEAKIEFYANLKWLREQYESGLVVAKFLYDKAVEEKNFKMKYVQFNKYFNDELNEIEKATKEQKAKEAAKEAEPVAKEDAETKPKSGPIVVRMQKHERVFDPLRGKNIDPSRIL
ncbi:MAG: hypothetical protein WCR69_04425 [Sulfuricurvum sp.]